MNPEGPPAAAARRGSTRAQPCGAADRGTVLLRRGYNGTS